VAEGDTIHRAADRITGSLGGRLIEAAWAPDPRSPLHLRAEEVAGHVLERAEARGKHLLLHLSGDLVVHSHLGIGGRWLVGEGEPATRRGAWLLLAGEGRWAAQIGGRTLRLLGARRARSDQVLARLGPDPLAAGFDSAAAAGRLSSAPAAEPVGAALLDQSLIAGIGNVIRIEALHAAGVSPLRRIGDLDPAESLAVVEAARSVMEETVRTGHRPKRIYGRRPPRCPDCGERLATGRQGDDARLTIWCERCQV
jgi:endonuclease VIII